MLLKNCMKNNHIKYFFLLLVWLVQPLFAVSFVNLEDYKYLLPLPKAKQKPLEVVLKNGWDEFKSNANESLVSDNIDSELFWELLRVSVEEGTLYNKIANYRIPVNKTGGDLFFYTLYASIYQIPVIYRSVTPLGDSIWLSGKIFLPRNKKAKNIIIANHYTICANSEAPSEAPSIEGLFATKEYIVLMPDYLGYGISSDWTHPYMHLGSFVSSALDLLNAAIPYLRYYSYSFDPSLIILGYSQGAAAALALQKAIEEDYSNRYSIEKVYAGGGPYDLAATYDYYISQNKIDIPCAMPMLFLGLNYAENLQLNKEDFFQPFLMDNYQEWIEDKTATMREVNAFLGNDIDSIFKPVIAQTDTLPASILYDAVNKNSIIDWTPQSPMFIFHSTNDNMVPFLNSEHLKEHFDEQGIDFVTYEFAPYGNHMRSAVCFFEKVYKRL